MQMSDSFGAWRLKVTALNLGGASRASETSFCYAIEVEIQRPVATSAIFRVAKIFKFVGVEVQRAIDRCDNLD